jgi:hypothetical protein
MLTHLFPFLDPVHIAPDLAPRLRMLADDCDRLRFGRPPSQRILEKAPLMEDWTTVLTPEGVKLVGRVSGHPIHGDRNVMTTPLWFAEPGATWVRSLSRFYRLGLPGDPEDLRRCLTSRSSDG